MKDSVDIIDLNTTASGGWLEMNIEWPDEQSPAFSSGMEYVNCYKEARDSWLSKVFPEYPDLTIFTFELSFSISGTAKNGPLVYSVLDVFPKEYYAADKNCIAINISSESELIEQIERISDILIIVKSWTSTKLMVNGTGIGTTTEFGYLVDYLFEKNNCTKQHFRTSVVEIKKRYNSRKSTTKAKEVCPQTLISRVDVIGALKKTINKYLDLYGHNKEIKQYEVSSHDCVVVIEDSLVVDFRLLPWYWTRKDDKSFKDWEHPYLMIQELTHNDLFKFNFADFKRHFRSDGVGMGFYPYHGVHYYNKEIDNYDAVDKALPELRLQDRYEQYSGESHHFVILRMENSNGKAVYGIGDTKGKVHSFVLKLCKELEEKGSRSLEIYGASCLSFNENRQFINAFLSWKGEKKRWRLENKFSYYYEDRLIKNDLELFSVPSEIIDAANNGFYDGCEFGSYNKPVNRWKSEELVYNITKKLYKDYQVIYQYKPFYLSTENGSMSYDIYICGLKVAIEYQGKQHFEPVDYFGGTASFDKQKERDRLKAKRSKENGVTLIYVNYWEDITQDLIRQKIADAISSRNSND